MKITKGDWKIKVGNLYAYSIEVTTKTVAYIPANDEAGANAALIAEAGTVANETGYTPRELAEQKKALLDACEILVRNPIIASVQARIKAHAEKEGLLNCMDLIFEAIAAATN